MRVDENLDRRGQSPALESKGSRLKVQYSMFKPQASSLGLRVYLTCLATVAVLVASLGAVDTLSERRRRVEAMSPEQLEELFHNEKQFHDLAPQEQQRIREFHEQIENAPDRDQLRATLNRYCKWFETQPAFRRAMLSDRKRPADDRVKMVKQFLLRQGPTQGLRLDDKNRRVVAAWLDRYTAENGPRFIENLPPGTHPGFSKLPTDRQQVVLREMLLRRWQTGGPGGQMPAVSEREAARLRAALSPDLRAKLEAKKPAEQARIIAEWLRETASHELDEELASFFENSISEEERDRLMAMQVDEMYDSLCKQYRAHVLKQSKPGEPAHRNGPPWPHGRHQGPPGRRRPEDREDAGPERDFPGNPPIAGAKPRADRPPEKHGPEKAGPEKTPPQPTGKPAANPPEKPAVKPVDKSAVKKPDDDLDDEE